MQKDEKNVILTREEIANRIAYSKIPEVFKRKPYFVTPLPKKLVAKKAVAIAR